MNHAVYYQRMNPEPSGRVIIPIPIESFIGVSTSIVTIDEGLPVQFNINRSGNLDTTCAVDWEVTSQGGAADLTGPTAGTTNFTPTGAQTQIVSVNTVKRSGLQNDRDVSIGLKNFVGCKVDPVFPVARITVKDVLPPPPPGDPGTGPVGNFAPSAPPTTSQILRVPEVYTLQQAIAAALPGQEISVADGYKTGAVNLARNMDETNWTVIRSRNLNKAIIDGRWTISGKGWWIHGFKGTFFSNNRDSCSFDLKTNYVVFTRNEIISANGIGSSVNNLHHIWIGWNTFNGYVLTDNGASMIWILQPDNWPNVASGPHDWDIYRNDFYDFAKVADGRVAIETHTVAAGPSHPTGSDLLTMENFYVRENWVRPGTLRTGAFYMKRGCIIQQNNVEGATYNCGYRHGGNGRFESNIINASVIIDANGINHKFYNNLVKGGGKLTAHCGASPSGPGSTPAYQAADYVEYDENTGPLELGYKSSKHILDNSQGGKTDHITIWKHNTNANITGNVAYYDVATYINYGNSKGLAYLPRLTLGANDVGYLGS